MDFLTEDEYLDALERMPKENQYLDDADPNKFVAKMGAEALESLLMGLDLDVLSFEFRHKANIEISQ
jgi:DNA-directed RNA polymerase subunit beta'